MYAKRVSVLKQVYVFLLANNCVYTQMSTGRGKRAVG